MASAALIPPPRDTAHLWIAGGGVLAVLACLALLGWTLLAGTPQPARQERVPVAAAPPPRPDDADVLLNNTPLAIAPADAVAINAARKLDRVRLTAARPFLLGPVLTAGEAGNAAALDCLTKAIYYEAASESDTGERAVAQVVLNRVRNPLFPHTVCGVVFQGSTLRTGCQFSFTCDGSLARVPSAAGWARARRIAAAALAGRVERSVGLATHYHADFVVPYWASSLDKAATIGAHIFYIMRGPRGTAASFREPYDALAEAPPSVTLDAAALDTPADAAAAELISPVPRDRTVVQEDALGTLGVPAPQPALPTGSTLRADENAGQLLLDRKEPVPAPQ